MILQGYSIIVLLRKGGGARGLNKWKIIEICYYVGKVALGTFS